jgi:hypothetical protein
VPQPFRMNGIAEKRHNIINRFKRAKGPGAEGHRRIRTKRVAWLVITLDVRCAANPLVQVNANSDKDFEGWLASKTFVRKE